MRSSPSTLASSGLILSFSILSVSQGETAPRSAERELVGQPRPSPLLCCVLVRCSSVCHGSSYSLICHMCRKYLFSNSPMLPAHCVNIFLIAPAVTHRPAVAVAVSAKAASPQLRVLCSALQPQLQAVIRAQ